jgi:hypothetical protein
LARNRSTLSTSIAALGTGHISHTNSLHGFYNAGGGGGAPLVAASNAPSFVKDRADWVCDGTSDSVEIQDALTSYGQAQLSTGTFNLAAGGITLGGDQRLSGQGPGTVVTWPGGTTGISIAANQRATVADMVLYHSGTAGQLVNIASNSFGAHFTRVRMYGQHINKTVSTYQSTYGVNITGNSGDCRFLDCDFGNLGRAFRSDSVQNQITLCRFTHNYIDVESTGSGCGMTMLGNQSSSTYGTSGATLRNIDLASGGELFIVSGGWFEGADYIIRAGTSGGNGVSKLVLRDFYSAAGIIGYEFRNCRPRVDSIRTSSNPTMTQTNTATTTGDAPYGIITDWVVNTGPSISYPAKWRVTNIDFVQAGSYP